MTWDYRIENAGMSEAELKDLGREGWELVTCIPHPGGYKLVFKKRLT